MKYIIVVESGADIPKNLAEKYGIYIVPMHVTFGSEVKDDGSFQPQEVCAYYENTKQLPKTSGCNPEDFITIFEQIRSEHPDSHIIYMAYSAVTTCSYQSARLAGAEYSNISYIDTKHVTIGQCSAVIRFAQELEKHPEWTIEEAVEAATNISNSVSMCFIPSTLDYLRAGGRVSNVAALCGNILSLHPKIELVDGYLKATKKYRGKMNSVVAKLISDFVAEQKLDPSELWMGCSPYFAEETKNEAIAIAHKLGFQKVNWIYTGGVITTHGGPNAFAIAGYKEM